MTLMALVVAVTAGAQSLLWNPDYNADEIVGTDDLLGLLTVFGMDWENVSIQYHETNFVYDSISIATHDTISILAETDVLVITAADTSNWVFREGVQGSPWQYSWNTITLDMPEEVANKSILLLFELAHVKVQPHYLNGWAHVLNRNLSFRVMPMDGMGNSHNLFSSSYSHYYSYNFELPFKQKKHLVYFDGSFWDD